MCMFNQVFKEKEIKKQQDIASRNLEKKKETVCQPEHSVEFHHAYGIYEHGNQKE